MGRDPFLLLSPSPSVFSFFWVFPQFPPVPFLTDSMFVQLFPLPFRSFFCFVPQCLPQSRVLDLPSVPKLLPLSPHIMARAPFLTSVFPPKYFPFVFLVLVLSSVPKFLSFIPHTSHHGQSPLPLPQYFISIPFPIPSAPPHLTSALPTTTQGQALSLLG